MHRAADILQSLRDRQLSWGLRAMAIIGFFVLLTSLLRTFTVGWKMVMLIQIILYAVILISAILDRHLSFSVRAIVMVSVVFILGLSGLVAWGFTGLGLLALFVFCILTTILFGTRIGIGSAVLSIIVIGVVGLLLRTGVLTINFNPPIYLMSSSACIFAMFSMALSAGIIVMALGTLNRQIENLVDDLQKQNRKMATVIRKLEAEMTQRARVEAERRQLETGLEQAKKMEALGTLAGGVAHDLNNILAGSVSYPDLLLNKLGQENPLRQPIETIKRSGVKAAAIVQDLLTLARRGVELTDVVDLNAIVSDYFTSLEYQQLKIFHPQVEVELRLDPELPNILGSPIHLLKTVMNLVSNAAEAIKDKGEVVVSTTREHIEARIGAYGEIKTGDYVVLRVSDTGAGISAAEIQKIFEPFYTKKRMGRSGTGLGMAVIWGTVKDHKGQIDIESVAEKGTTFSLFIPATAQKRGQQETAPRVKDVMGRGESILIIDDVKEQREIACEMLRELGYAVKTVASGEEALAYLKKDGADLLVLDMYMDPGMDGLDTYRQALKLRPHQKAVITSGYTETGWIEEAQRLGAGPYLRKPFFLYDIGAAIRAELDRGPGR